LPLPEVTANSPTYTFGPVRRLLNVCRGKRETTSSHTIPAWDIEIVSRPAISLALGIIAKENGCQSAVSPPAVPYA
jgi:hypothetical protein